MTANISQKKFNARFVAGMESAKREESVAQLVLEIVKAQSVPNAPKPTGAHRLLDELYGTAIDKFVNKHSTDAERQAFDAGKRAVRRVHNPNM